MTFILISKATPLIISAVVFVAAAIFFVEADLATQEETENIYFCKGRISGKHTKTTFRNKTVYSYPVEYCVNGIRKNGYIHLQKPSYREKDPVDVIVDLNTMRILRDAA